MTDFLFHKVNDKERQEIKEQAKSIIENFSKKLDKANKKISESFIERDQMERSEKNSKECDKEFRKLMFENAPNKNENFIIAEKKTW